MKIFRSMIQIFKEALFPLSYEEKIMLSMDGKTAYQSLPHSPCLTMLNSFAVFSYKSPITQKMVWNIKYKKSETASEIAAYCLAKKLNELIQKFQWKKVIVLPMPITKRRRRERGFNQCELITRKMKRQTFLRESVSFEEKFLNRDQHRERQTVKNRQERLMNAKDAFSINKSIHLPFSAVFIIIDDVITTGSTMKEAMETIKKSGYNNVFGLSLSH